MRWRLKLFLLLSSKEEFYLNIYHRVMEFVPRVGNLWELVPAEKMSIELGLRSSIISISISSASSKTLFLRWSLPLFLHLICCWSSSVICCWQAIDWMGGGPKRNVSGVLLKCLCILLPEITCWDGMLSLRLLSLPSKNWPDPDGASKVGCCEKFAPFWEVDCHSNIRPFLCVCIR